MNLDEIGPWSEIKLDILRDYAAPYSAILKSNGFHHGYIDAFSGPRLHIRKIGGDRSWHSAMFRPSAQTNLFGDEEMDKTENRDLVNAYCKRLKEVAGFGFVADPLAMRNSRNAIVYYLIFAGPNRTGWKIVQDIYRKYPSA